MILRLAPRRRVVPQEEGRLQGNQGPVVIWNQPWSVVTHRARGGNSSGIQETAHGSDRCARREP